MLTSLYSTVTRQGHATELMRIVTEWADENNVTLILEARQYGNPRGMSTEDLRQFYGRFGFIPKGVMMYRVSQELHAL